MELRIVHSAVTCSNRSAGVDVFIVAVISTASVFGADTDVLLAVTVILSAGRLDAAPARLLNAYTLTASSSAASTAFPARRSVRVVGMSRITPLCGHTGAGERVVQDATKLQLWR